jgi:hypothetical protein
MAVQKLKGGVAMAVLAGRVAVVTGASAGIGAGLAAMLAAEGATVVLAARRERELAGVADGIRRRGGVAIPVVTDLTSDESIARLLKTAQAEAGPVDVLVNNAGYAVWKPLEETASADDLPGGPPAQAGQRRRHGRHHRAEQRTGVDRELVPEALQVIFVDFGAAAGRDHVEHQRRVDLGGDPFDLVVGLRRLDEDQVRALRRVPFRPGDRLVDPGWAAGVGAGDDDGAGFPRVEGRVQLARELAGADATVADRILAEAHGNPVRWLAATQPEYRMDVYSIAEDDQVLLAGFTVPPDAVHRPAGSLADYGDDELMSELAWRLGGRG